MGLVDKLTEVDEAVWKQYEKITNYCNKEYGWNKYDLARKTQLGMTASFLSEGTYITLEGLVGNSPLILAFGAFASLVAVGFHYLAKRRLAWREEREVHLLERTGAATEPTFTGLRPALFLANFSLSSYFIYNGVTQQYDSPYDLSLPREQYNFFVALVNIGYFLWNIFNTSEWYFQDQIMTPSKKKKKVLKMLLEKAKGKVQVAPVPQPQPVKYHSIDTIVEGA